MQDMWHLRRDHSDLAQETKSDAVATSEKTETGSNETAMTMLETKLI